LVLCKEELRKFHDATTKKTWHGVRLTYADFVSGDWDVRFEMDEQSRPWRGNELQERERELLTIGRIGICGRCDWHTGIPHSLKGTWEWHRGFVEEITCAAEDWLQHGDAIAEATPLRLVRLTDLFEPRYGRFADGKFCVSFPDGSNEIEQMVERGPGWQVCKALCEQRWPGIAFELPPSTPIGFVNRYPFTDANSISYQDQ
jgi:hypothetical protein